MFPTFQQHWHALPPNTRGALWALLGALFMSTMATLVKYLGKDLSSFEIAFFRAFFGLLIIMPFVWHAGTRTLRTKRLPMHLFRGALGATAMLTGFYAITKLPLALATSLSFARPLFMIILAIIFLGEVVRARRWTATIVGFAGVIVMMRPTGAIEPAAYLSLFSAFLVAGAMVITKKMTATEQPVTMIFYAGVFGTFFTLAPAITVWEWPTMTQIALLVLMGVVGTLAQNSMIRALRAGEATVVTPVEYIRIIFAAGYGFLLFAEVPDIWIWAGAAIIVASTLYITVREARLGKPKPPAPADV